MKSSDNNAVSNSPFEKSIEKAIQTPSSPPLSTDFTQAVMKKVLEAEKKRKSSKARRFRQWWILPTIAGLYLALYWAVDTLPLVLDKMIKSEYWSESYSSLVQLTSWVSEVISHLYFKPVFFLLMTLLFVETYRQLMRMYHTVDTHRYSAL